MNLLSGGNPMTEQELASLGPAFVSYPGRFRTCFRQKRTAAHLDTYCRGLLSDLPRKSVEPIALEAGTAVRTPQEFLVTAHWDHEAARTLLQRDLAAVVAALPGDTLGAGGGIAETRCRECGDHTPGVQRICSHRGECVAKPTTTRAACTTATTARPWLTPRARGVIAGLRGLLLQRGGRIYRRKAQRELAPVARHARRAQLAAESVRDAPRHRQPQPDAARP